MGSLHARPEPITIPMTDFQLHKLMPHFPGWHFHVGKGWGSSVYRFEYLSYEHRGSDETFDPTNPGHVSVLTFRPREHLVTFRQQKVEVPRVLKTLNGKTITTDAVMHDATAIYQNYMDILGITVDPVKQTLAFTPGLKAQGFRLSGNEAPRLKPWYLLSTASQQMLFS